MLVPYIIKLGKTSEIRYQMHQFLIFIVIVKRQNRDAVVYLKSEGINGVIDNGNIFEIPVFDYS